MNHLESLLNGKIVKILTILLSIMSLTSAIQRIFSVGLVPLLSSYVNYYHQISHFFIGIPFEWIGIKIPTLLIDFWIVSFVCAGAYAKSKNVEKSRAFENYNFKCPSPALRMAVFFVFGFTGIGLFVPMSALSIYTYTRDDITREALKNTLWVLAGTVFVFFLNAFAPSA